MAIGAGTGAALSGLGDTLLKLILEKQNKNEDLRRRNEDISRDEAHFGAQQKFAEGGRAIEAGRAAQQYGLQREQLDTEKTNQGLTTAIQVANYLDLWGKKVTDPKLQSLVGPLMDDQGMIADNPDAQAKRENNRYTAQTHGYFTDELAKLRSLNPNGATQAITGVNPNQQTPGQIQADKLAQIQAGLDPEGDAMRGLVSLTGAGMQAGDPAAIGQSDTLFKQLMAKINKGRPVYSAGATSAADESGDALAKLQAQAREKQAQAQLKSVGKMRPAVSHAPGMAPMAPTRAPGMDPALLWQWLMKQGKPGPAGIPNASQLQQQLQQRMSR